MATALGRPSSGALLAIANGAFGLLYDPRQFGW